MLWGMQGEGMSPVPPLRSWRRALPGSLWEAPRNCFGSFLLFWLVSSAPSILKRKRGIPCENKTRAKSANMMHLFWLLEQVGTVNILGKLYTMAWPRVQGPKCQSYQSIWALKPYYLGPWTLRVIPWQDRDNQNVGHKDLFNVHW